MNVSSIGQGPGSVLALPGPRTERAAEAAPSSRGSKTDGGVVRLAWFDLNGDGHIDSRSSISGGDGTLIVNAHASQPLFTHNVKRSAQQQPAVKTESPTPSSEPAPQPVPAGDVQTRQAINAYQRYGQPTDNATPARAVA
jgi:hypothetical protein